jgi:3-deoxy-manno-octulosonate cytidylyltransferase (CMP-KDO synthetase)
MKDNKVLGVIPARYGSTRFPGKPLIDIKGKTMIRRVYEGAIKSSSIDKLVVATDDDRIAEEVYKFGGEVCMTSNLHTTGTDRCGEVAKKFEDFDVIINIQGDEPLVDYKQLDSLSESFYDTSVLISTLGIKETSNEDVVNPNRVKAVVDSKNNALYFSRSVIPSPYNSKGNHIECYPYMKHLGLYAFKREILLELIELPITKLESIESLEQLRWLYFGYPIRLIETQIETPNVDTPEDLERILKTKSHLL